MPRFKEFDSDSVLERAIDIFWEKGFEATSIQDLVIAMGINRGSIYDTFGSKAKLFNLALSRYQRDSPSQKLLNNAKTGNPREEIEEYFNGLVNLYGRPDEKRGCLITNSIAELACKDAELALHFESHIRSLENALYTLIRRGQETGDVSPWCNARALARSLLASAQGLILISKVNQDHEVLLDIAATAISTLE